MTHPWYNDEDRAWDTVKHDHLWIFDKLILSKKMGYICGPIGFDVPTPNYYIVRPCVNVLGLGLGAQIIYIEKETINLSIGHFWCEIFNGRHLSVDYEYGQQFLCVEGIREKYKDDLTKWDKWVKTNDVVHIPRMVRNILEQYKYSNCEYIDGNLIEIHLRRNPDFYYAKTEYIPVFTEDFEVPDGYEFVRDPEENSRVGAFVK